MTDRLFRYFREDFGKISVRVNHRDPVGDVIVNSKKQTRSCWIRIPAGILECLDLKKTPGVDNPIRRISAEFREQPVTMHIKSGIITGLPC